jgi:hypothetical protein
MFLADRTLISVGFPRKEGNPLRLKVEILTGEETLDSAENVEVVDELTIVDLQTDDSLLSEPTTKGRFYSDPLPTVMPVHPRADGVIRLSLPSIELSLAGVPHIQTITVDSMLVLS